jgi:hypothetical protein
VVENAHWAWPHVWLVPMGARLQYEHLWSLLLVKHGDRGLQVQSLQQYMAGTAIIFVMTLFAMRSRSHREARGA